MEVFLRHGYARMPHEVGNSFDICPVGEQVDRKRVAAAMPRDVLSDTCLGNPFLQLQVAAHIRADFELLLSAKLLRSTEN